MAMTTEIYRERLAAFIFRLMRDEIPSGRIEEHTQVVEGAHSKFDPVSYVGAAGPLGEYARTIAERLVPNEAVRIIEHVDPECIANE